MSVVTTVHCDGCEALMPRQPDMRPALVEGGSLRTFDFCQPCMDRLVALLDPRAKLAAAGATFLVFPPPPKKK